METVNQGYTFDTQEIRLLTKEAAVISVDSQRKRRSEFISDAFPRKLLFAVAGSIFFFGRLERLLQANHIFARSQTIKGFSLTPQFVFGIVRRLDRKTDPSLCLIHFDNATFNILADFQHILDLGNMFLAQLRDMDYAVT